MVFFMNGSSKFMEDLWNWLFCIYPQLYSCYAGGSINISINNPVVSIKMKNGLDEKSRIQ
jgi:hypothetical protein